MSSRAAKNGASKKRRLNHAPKEGSRPALEDNAFYQVLFERHPHPMWVFDPKTLRILEVNAAAVEHYGYAREEFLSMSLVDLRPAEEVPALVSYLEGQRQQGSTRSLGRTEPFVHRKRDGAPIAVEISWSRVPFAGKTAILAMANDVTERAKTQDQIRRGLDRLQILHEISAAITTTLDLDTVLEFFLRKANRLLPYSVFTIKLWNEERKVLEPTLCRNLDEREWKTELRRRNRGLTEIPFQTNEPLAISRIDTDPRSGRPEFARKHGLVSYLGVPLSVKGDVIGVLSTFTKEEHQFTRDEIEFYSTLASQVAFAVHNAKIFEQAQQNLKRLHALYEINTAIAPLLEVRLVVDALLKKIAGLLPYAALTIRLFNETTGKLDAAACWNIDEAEWKSEEANPPHGFARAVFETKAPIAVRDVRADPIVSNHDLFRRHGLVSCLGVPLMSEDKVLGAMTFYAGEEREFASEEVEFLSTLAGVAGIAIQKSRLYEEATETARSLERASRVKDEFLSMVSHELRTPLNVVMGFTGLIKDRLLGEITAEQEEALGKIQARTNDQLTLVNNILYATVLETTGIQGNTFAVSIGDFFERLKEAYQLPVGKEIRLEWHLPPRGLVMHTDPDKLKHVLQNLIDNAIKFTPEGSVTVSARALPDSCALEIKVSDTGIGIAGEHLPIIFEKFRQVDGSKVRAYGGVGLGLYVVRRFTEALGGKIEVESELGQGSTFTVTIPC